MRLTGSGKHLAGRNYFNPRTSYEVRQALGIEEQKDTKGFQSTHFIRSATIKRFLIVIVKEEISIHALHTKCDGMVISSTTGARKFQSTHFIRSATSAGLSPVYRNQWFQSTHFIRSATMTAYFWTDEQIISIHALHTKCDSIASITFTMCWNFNPRTSYEVRLIPKNSLGSLFLFQSTHFIRSATGSLPIERVAGLDFNPRTSYEVRR